MTMRYLDDPPPRGRWGLPAGPMSPVPGLVLPAGQMSLPRLPRPLVQPGGFVAAPNGALEVAEMVVDAAPEPSPSGATTTAPRRTRADVIRAAYPSPPDTRRAQSIAALLSLVGAGVAAAAGGDGPLGAIGMGLGLGGARASEGFEAERERHAEALRQWSLRAQLDDFADERAAEREADRRRFEANQMLQRRAWERADRQQAYERDVQRDKYRDERTAARDDANDERQMERELARLDREHEYAKARGNAERAHEIELERIRLRNGLTEIRARGAEDRRTKRTPSADGGSGGSGGSTYRGAGADFHRRRILDLNQQLTNPDIEPERRSAIYRDLEGAYADYDRAVAAGRLTTDDLAAAAPQAGQSVFSGMPAVATTPVPAIARARGVTQEEWDDLMPAERTRILANLPRR